MIDRYDTLAQLRQIPDLAVEVAMTAGAKNPSDRPLVAARSAFPAPPADLGAIDCLDPNADHEGALLWHLGQAVRAVWEELDRRPALSNPPRLASECSWLLNHAETWQQDRWLTEFVGDEVWTVYAALAREARLPRPTLLVCPQCGGRMVPSAGDWLTCIDCAAQAPGSARIIAWARRAEPMTTDRIAEMLGITPQAIWQWRHRHKLQPINAGYKPLLWLPWDVLRLARPDIVHDIESHSCDLRA